MSGRDRARAWLPYVVAGTSGFLIAFLLVALVLFPADDAPQEVRVPSVMGLPLVDARRRLTSVGLKGSLGQERPSADAPPNAIVSQTPVAGETVNVGTEVVLDVSAGQPRATVPSLIGLARDAAEQQLKTAGLATGDVTQEVSDSARGMVLSSLPSPGATVPLATRVGLVVSGGPRELSLPDVVGRDLDSARNGLEQLGLPVAVNYDSLSTAAAGTVVAQTPAAGAVVTGASTVTLRVSGKP